MNLIKYKIMELINVIKENKLNQDKCIIVLNVQKHIHFF